MCCQLLAIFEELRKRRQNGKLIEFDVSRTIFVCNKWDLVEEEEEDVWNYILEKLREHWPNFNEKQLFKLSVKEVLITVLINPNTCSCDNC